MTTDPTKSCVFLFCLCFKRFFDLIKAILVRSIMSATIFLLTWRAASVHGATEFSSDVSGGSTIASGQANNSAAVTSHYIAEGSGISHHSAFVYWMPMLGIAAFLPEFLFTWCINHGNEYKWWSPAMLIFVVSSLTPIWMMELHLYAKKWEGVLQQPNATNFEELTIFQPEMFGTVANFNFGGVMFKEFEWARILKQFFFISIIFTKWLCPKGVLTRDQLSQMLLVYIAMATDVLDLIESLMFYGIGNVLEYILYSLPHIQFTLNYTATLSKNSRFVHPSRDYSPKKRKCIRYSCFCFRTELWSLLLAITLQEGPFLIIRMFFIFEKNIITFANLFFTVKNAMVLIMDIYRVISIIREQIKHNRKSNGDSDDEGGYDDEDEDDDEDKSILTNAFLYNNDRAEIRLVIESDNSVQGIAEYVFGKPHPDNYYDNSDEDNSDVEDGDRVKRKYFRKLPSKTSPFVDGRGDESVHLIYEIDLVIDKQCLNINILDDSNIPEYLIIKEVRIKNVSSRQANILEQEPRQNIRQRRPAARNQLQVGVG